MDDLKTKKTAHRQAKKQMLEMFIEQCKVKGITKNTQEAKKMVDQMDKSIWEKCVGDIEEYKGLMRKEIERVTCNDTERALSANSNISDMISAMVSSLDQLKHFRDTTSGIGPNDMNLLTNLIEFIEKIMVTKQSEIKENMTKTIALYYDRLFTPIYKTIMNSMHKDPPRYKPPTPQQPPIQQIPPVAPPAPVAPPPQAIPPQPPQRIQQMAPAPVQVPEPTQPSAQPRSDDESRAMVSKLFSQVRTECAVFYATPHPPHF